jgi:hypothetical protein
VATEKQLAELVKRRHPKYDDLLEHWNFVESTYEGGREWFKKNIFRYLKEGETEYKDRVKRAYRFNHTAQVVDVVNEYLFKVPIGRRAEDAPQPMKDFWLRSTRSGLTANEYAKRISTATSQFGRVWVVVDSTARDSGNTPKSIKDEKDEDSYIYSYMVRPQQALDMGHDDDNKLLWILLHELHRDDEDPIESTGKVLNRYRLWTRESWYLYEEQYGLRGKPRIVEIDSGDHNLGLVPVFPADNVFSEDPYSVSGLVDEVSYMDRSNANYMSNLDAVIQDQTFSQLVLPAQGLMPGEDGYNKLLEMGTKRVFIYNGESGKGPEYISPDVKQAELILAAVGKIINEIYHSVGLAAERTKEDNGGGIDNSSGVAKSYDFERVNGMLVSKADALESFEARMTMMVMAWSGTPIAYEEARALVTYPRDFDVRGLYDEFEIANQLALLQAPDALRREQMQTVIKKLMPTLSKEKQALIDASLKTWPPEPVVEPAAPGKSNSPSGAKSSTGASTTAK